MIFATGCLVIVLHICSWAAFGDCMSLLPLPEDIDAYNDGVKGNPSKAILAAAERGAGSDAAGIFVGASDWEMEMT